jgi:hypothetical protein
MNFMCNVSDPFTAIFTVLQVDSIRKDSFRTELAATVARAARTLAARLGEAPKRLSGERVRLQRTKGVGQ